MNGQGAQSGPPRHRRPVSHSNGSRPPTQPGIRIPNTAPGRPISTGTHQRNWGRGSTSQLTTKTGSTHQAKTEPAVITAGHMPSPAKI